jgi:hypothetical protein
MRLTISYIERGTGKVTDQVVYPGIDTDEVTRIINLQSQMFDLKAPGEGIIITVQEEDEA